MVISSTSVPCTPSLTNSASRPRGRVSALIGYHQRSSAACGAASGAIFAEARWPPATTRPCACTADRSARPRRRRLRRRGSAADLRSRRPAGPRRGLRLERRARASRRQRPADRASCNARGASSLGSSACARSGEPGTFSGLADPAGENPRAACSQRSVAGTSFDNAVYPVCELINFARFANRGWASRPSVGRVRPLAHRAEREQSVAGVRLGVERTGGAVNAPRVAVSATCLKTSPTLPEWRACA